MDSHDSEEIASIKRDARNQIAESLKDIRNFVISSLNGKTRGRLFIGKLKSATSDKIKTDTNISTEGYSVILTSDEIKHIFKQRGDTEKEALRGQEALSVDNNPSINTIYIDVNAGKAKVDGMFDCALVETLLNLLILLTVCLKKKLLRWQNRMRCSDYRIQFFK